MKVLTDLDLRHNELQNAAIHVLTTPPITPVVGQIYYDTSLNALRIYDGAAWQSFDAALDPRLPLAMEPEQIISGIITRNAQEGIISAPVVWPDGSLGTFTALSFNATYPGAIDSYTVTHTDLGLVYFQPGVTRDAAGFVTNRPTMSGAVFFVRQTNPDRTEVYSAGNGNKLAVFTDGSRTAHIYRTPRTFTEQKAPFTDLFDRVKVAGWGPSPGGGNWNNFNGLAVDYNVNGVATITPSTTGVSRYVRLNDIVGEFDARLSFSLSTVPVGSSNSLSLMCGFQTTSNHIRMRLTVNSTGTVVASIAQFVGGNETVLSTAGTIGTGYAANEKWHIRGVFDGVDAYEMYAWKDGDTEPVTPTVTATCDVFPTGKLGVRALAGLLSTNNPTFTVYDFSATALWPVPPVVTHNVWARLLPAPFNGTVDVVWLGNQINSSSTTDEVLAIGMQYITGAAAVMDGPLQIGGDGGYGPLYNIGRSFELAHADDGTRQEGSDWNDYLGIVGNYPDLTVPTTDNPEAHQLHCTDCSGTVRIVYGYRLGLPMCLDDEDDFDGVNIPRRAVDQASDGPGTVVFTGATPPTQATLDKLMPGDVVFFDADNSNPDEEEGQIDHNGIYIGLDTEGKPRFLSSRKTANGPTFGDLGGASVINGTGLYGRSLRSARRY